jgi:hypothetical protein
MGARRNAVNPDSSCVVAMPQHPESLAWNSFTNAKEFVSE